MPLAEFIVHASPRPLRQSRQTRDAWRDVVQGEALLARGKALKGQTLDPPYTVDLVVYRPTEEIRGRWPARADMLDVVEVTFEALAQARVIDAVANIIEHRFIHVPTNDAPRFHVKVISRAEHYP